MSESSDKSEWVSRSYPIEEDMALQRKGWRVESIGWIALFIFLAAALLGLFSQGILSSGHVAAGGLSLEYDRFLRLEADHSIRITVSDTNEVLIGGGFPKNASINAIVPSPGEAAMGPEGLRLRYTASDGKTMIIDIAYRPTAPGIVRTDVTAGPSKVSFWQLVYP